MATNPWGFDPRTATVLNPLSNPYWGTDGSLGGGNGRGVFDWQKLAALGYDVGMFAETPMDGDVSPGAIDAQATADWLAQNGLQLMEQQTPEGVGYRFVVDAQGNVVGEPERTDYGDSGFWNAALAAAALTGANIYAAGSGAASAGAAVTGTGGATTAAPAAVSGGNALTAGGSALGAAPAGSGLTAGANALYAPTGFAGGSGSALAGTSLGGASALGGSAALGGTAAVPGTAMSTGFLGMSPNTWAQLGQTAIGLYGQNQAINAAQDATAESNALARYVYDQNRADNKPLVDLRNSVLPQIQGLLSNPNSITQDPGYQFQFNEGMRARQNSAAGAGMTYSGAQQKALTRYGQDYAGTKLDQSLNRLTSVAGLGQVGSNNNQQATNQYGNTVGGNALAYGDARGSAYVGGANLAGNALSRIFNPNQYRNINGGP